MRPTSIYAQRTAPPLRLRPDVQPEHLVAEVAF